MNAPPIGRINKKGCLGIMQVMMILVLVAQSHLKFRMGGLRGHLIVPQFRSRCGWEPHTSPGEKLFSFELMYYKFSLLLSLLLKYGNIKSQSFPVF